MKFETIEELNSLDLEAYTIDQLETYSISYRDFEILVESFETHFQVTKVFHQKIWTIFEEYEKKVGSCTKEEIVSNFDNKDFIEFTPSGLSKVSQVLKASILADYSYWEELESHIRYLIIKLIKRVDEQISTEMIRFVHKQFLDMEEMEKIKYLGYALSVWLPEGSLYIY